MVYRRDLYTQDNTDGRSRSCQVCLSYKLKFSDARARAIISKRAGREYFSLKVYTIVRKKLVSKASMHEEHEKFKQRRNVSSILFHIPQEPPYSLLCICAMQCCVFL